MLSRLACALSLLGTTALAQSPRSAVIEALRTRLQTDLAAEDVGGITAAVVVGDTIVWAEGFGWADRTKRIPAGPATIYRIGSITKTFTVAVLAQLVDRKILALDDPVEKYLPEIRGLGKPQPGAAPVTFRQLASHTAGIIRDVRLAGAAVGPVSEWEAKALAAIQAASYDTLPGARYAYSNVGFSILGLALSRAARTPYPRLVEEGIFAPLGMRSVFVVPDALRPSLAIGYAVDASGGINSSASTAGHAGLGYAAPAGAIYATVNDLARFISALTASGKRIMSDSMRLAMMTKQTMQRGSNGYGLGLEVTVNGGVKVAGHGGVVNGYFSAIAFDPETKIGVILLRNFDGSTPLTATANQTVRDLVAERRGLRATVASGDSLLSGIPNTSAGRLLSDWMRAMNSGDPARLDQFHEKWFGRSPASPATAEDMTSGGYDLRSVIESSGTRIEVVAQERADVKAFVKLTAAVFAQNPERMQMIGKAYTSPLGGGAPPKLSAAQATAARSGPPFRQFSAWLDAFNAGDREGIQKFLETHWDVRALQSQMSLRDRSGGLELIRLEQATERSVTGTLKQRGPDGFLGFILSISPTGPNKITRFATFPVPGP